MPDESVLSPRPHHALSGEGSGPVPIRLLHVEDSPVDAALARAALEREGGEFSIAQTGTLAEALQRLELPSGPACDIILVDMVLPDGDGLALIGHVRDRDLPVALVAVTGAGDDRTVFSALKAGADDYVIKKDDYLTRLAPVLRGALGRFRRSESARRRPIHVLLASAERPDATARRLAKRAPYLQIEAGVLGDVVARIRTDSEVSVDVLVLQLGDDAIGVLDVVKELREALRIDLPTVVVASRRDEDMALRAMRLGVNEYLVKGPGYLRQLPAAIEQAHARAELERERTRLRESEQRRLIALEAGTMMDWHWDIASDRMLWGRDPAWMLGPAPDGGYADFRIMVHPDDRAAFLAAGQRSITQGVPYRAEFRVVRTDGQIRWLLGQGKPLRGPSGDVVALTGINLDITESKRAEALMREKDERLRIAMHAGRLIEWEWDVPSDVLVWGDDPSPVLGPPLDTGGRRYPDFRELVLPEDRPGFLSAGRRCLAEGGDYHAEFRITTTDGRTRWLVTRGRGIRNDAGVVTRMVGVALDLTDLRLAEQARRDSERRLRAFIDHSPALISLTDVEGRYLLVNRGYAETLGIDSERVAGKAQHELFPAAYADGYVAHVERVARTGRAISMQDAVPFPDGERSFFTTRVPIYGAGGRLMAIGAIATDITALRRAESELMRLNAELEQRVAERTDELRAAVSELDAFTHTVAHDLRAPVRAMSGFAHALLADLAGSLDAEHARMLRRIERNGVHMQQLIDDLLAFSRAGRAPVERKLIELSTLAHDCVEIQHPESEQRDLEIRIGPLGSARVDPGLFRQVFANLITNAVKFSRGRSQARIEVGRTEQAGEPVWFVRDNGVGFDMRHAGKLFRVFQRLHRKEQFEGSGVGLANAARIIERHGGRIWAEAAPDQGATFYFTIGH